MSDLTYRQRATLRRMHRRMHGISIEAFDDENEQFHAEDAIPAPVEFITFTAPVAKLYVQMICGPHQWIIVSMGLAQDWGAFPTRKAYRHTVYLP